MLSLILSFHSSVSQELTPSSKIYNKSNKATLIQVNSRGLPWFRLHQTWANLANVWKSVRILLFEFLSTLLSPITGGMKKLQQEVHRRWKNFIATGKTSSTFWPRIFRWKNFIKFSIQKITQNCLFRPTKSNLIKPSLETSLRWEKLHRTLKSQ